MATEMVTVSSKVPANVNIEYSVLEKVLMHGDLSELKPAERMMYYSKTCESLRLNPLTRPFEYLKLNGKLTFYARKDATDQIRKVHNVSITSLESKVVNDIYIVTVAGECNGKRDVATGAVNIKGLSGDNLANAMMKAETKAKRRLTLSIVGLGMLDESEIETIKDAKIIAEKDITPSPALEDYVENIKLAQTEEEVIEICKEGYKVFAKDRKALEQLKEEKGKRKAVLVAEHQKFIAEMDGKGSAARTCYGSDNTHVDDDRGFFE